MNIFSRKNLKHILTSTILNRILNNLGKSLHYLDKHQKIRKNQQNIVLDKKFFSKSLGVNHQLCTFHLFQTIHHKSKVYCIRNKINGKERDYIMKMQELKDCFRQNSTKEAIEHFKLYLQNYRAIPVVLKDFIRKHIINHFHRYVQHLDDENIEKTSNKVENYYRQTNPEIIKFYRLKDLKKK